MNIIIKNGMIVNARESFKADIKIEDGIISTISNEIKPERHDSVIDAKDRLVFPGAIDPHTHFSNKGFKDDFESGTKAAAVGGVTSIINMNDGLEKKDTLIEHFDRWKDKAYSSVIDYSFHTIISGPSYNENTLNELDILAKKGIKNIKLFTAYKGDKMVNDREMYKIMKKEEELNFNVLVHAENGDIIDESVLEFIDNGKVDAIYHSYSRPPIVEAEATERVLAIAEVTNSKVYVVHVTCKEALEQVEKAKRRGVNAYAETCTQYLVLDESYLKLPKFESAKYVCS